MNKPKNWQHYSVQLAKAKINFYEPFERLIFRKIVEDVLTNTGSQRIDLFAIFDAVSKRGGLHQVEQKKRWTQIEYSLPYYKYNFKQIYEQHLLKKQDEIKAYLKKFDKEYTTNQEIFIEVYFLTNSSAGGFYHFQDDENSFCKQNFTYVDQYLNVKCISTFPCPISKITTQYAQKYLLTRKWLILKGYSRPFSQEELDRLQIMKIYNNNASVALIGWNISNLILALRLHQLKFNVVLYTNINDQYDVNTLQRMLSVKQGIFILDNGIGGPFSYSELFAYHGIQLAEVSNYCTLIDQNEQTLPQYRVRESEQLFLSLLADFKFEDSNKKLLKNQINTLLAKKRLNDEHNLMKWHLQRYLMINNFHGQETTVHLHSGYLNRRKHKIFMQKKRPVYIKNCLNLVERALKSFKVIQLKPRNIDFCNNIWIVEQRMNEKRSFSSLVYSDAEQLHDMISKRSYKIPSMMNENFNILRELSSNTWIHCSFRFKQKLKLKPQLVVQISKRRKDFLKFCHFNIFEDNCSFQFSSTFGFYYYYVIERGLGLIASCKVQKFMFNSATAQQLKKSLPSQMLKQFEINILSYKLPELSQPQVIEYSHSFFLKDDSLNRDKIVKLKSWQRMYLLVGYPWALNPNKLTSQIDCSNQILALISNVYYSLYKFDSTAKEGFDNFYKIRKDEMMGKMQKQQIKQKSLEISQNTQSIKETKKNVTQLNPMKESEKIMNQQEKCKQNQIIQIQQEKTQIINIKIQVKHSIFPLCEDIFIEQGQKIVQEQQFNKNDLFGFQNTFIRQSYDFITQKTSQILKQIQQKLNTISEKQAINQLQSQENQQCDYFRQKIFQLYSLITKYQQSFSLQQQLPYKLAENHFLHCLGKVRIENFSVKKLVQKVKKLQQEIQFYKQSAVENNVHEKDFSLTIDLFLFDGFMSKMEFYSLDNPCKSAVYVQTVLYVEQKNSMENQNVSSAKFLPIFVIFDETNLAIFYYHSSLKILTEMFNNQIQKKRKEMSERNKPVFRRKQYKKNIKQNSNKIKLMLEQIKCKIEEQIECQSQKSDFLTQQQLMNKILNDKLNSNLPQDCDPDQFTKILYPQNNQQKTQFLMNALRKMAEKQLKVYQLKSQISLMDVFFGYLSNQMFIFEMFWNRKIQLFSKSSTTYLETFQQMIENIKKNDPVLYEQIQKVRNQKQENEYSSYPLNVDFDQQSLVVQRKFLASKNDPVEINQQKNQEKDMELQQNLKRLRKNPERLLYTVKKNQLLKSYFLIKQFTFKQNYLSERKNDRQRIRCFLLIGEDDRRIQLDPKQDPLELIVSILVDTWDIQEIYDHFKSLLLTEINNCEQKLQKKMYLYYQSTRKIPQLLNFSQVPQLISTLNYKKPKTHGNKYLEFYPTQYCSDQEDKQTLLQHLSNQNIVFADSQIIFCKY